MRQAVPIRGSIVGHNYYDISDRDIGYGGMDVAYYQWSDVLPLSHIRGPWPAGMIEAMYEHNFSHNFSNREFYIRFCKPHYSAIEECYLDLDCSFSGNNGVRIALAKCDNLTRVALSGQEIDNSWFKVAGKPKSIAGSGRIIIQGLSLKNIIENIQSRDELFALCLSFDSAPQDFFINKLNLLLGTKELV